MTTTLLAKDIDGDDSGVRGLRDRADENTFFLVVPQSEIDLKSPLTSEKMSRFLTLFRADDFADATQKAVQIQSVLGSIPWLPFANGCTCKRVGNEGTKLPYHC